MSYLRLHIVVKSAGPPFLFFNRERSTFRLYTVPLVLTRSMYPLICLINSLYLYNLSNRVTLIPNLVKSNFKPERWGIVVWGGQNFPIWPLMARFYTQHTPTLLMLAGIPLCMFIWASAYFICIIFWHHSMVTSAEFSRTWYEKSSIRKFVKVEGFD